MHLLALQVQPDGAPQIDQRAAIGLGGAFRLEGQADAQAAAFELGAAGVDLELERLVGGHCHRKRHASRLFRKGSILRPGLEQRDIYLDCAATRATPMGPIDRESTLPTMRVVQILVRMPGER